MAFVKIRGSQIQDGQLKDQHIASDASISESKLSIDWTARAVDVLETKKVVDFVQVNNKAVGDLSEFDLSGAGVIANTVASATSPGTEEGVLVDAPKNYAPIRDVATGEPILSATNAEVYGRVEFVASPDAGATPAKFVLKFFSMESDGLGGLVETAFTMPASTNIDFQFAQRFNLQSVNEMFAANEKFVEGAADATAHLNIEQLAKDLYGSTFSLDRDGSANLTRSLVDEILIQTRGLTNTTVRASEIIDEVVSARGTFASISGRFSDIENDLSQLSLDLASTATGKGASLIGVEDSGLKFTATTVEGVLAELEGRVSGVEGGGSATGTEVETARKQTNLTGTEVVHADLDTRLETTDAVVKATKDEVDATHESTAKSADGGVTPKTFASLDARLEEIESDHATEVTDRTNADQAIRDDFASTATGKGASLVGIEDVGGKVTATTVEGAVIELADRATAVEGRATDLETEVQAARKSTALTGVEVVHADVDARLEAGETQIKANQDEITAARGTETSLDVRLDRALNENGTLKAGTQIHDHKKFLYQATGGETSVSLPAGDTFQSDDSLDVFVNGLLQAKGIHYSEMVDVNGNGTGVDFAPEVLVAGDIVILKYVKNNAE